MRPPHPRRRCKYLEGFVVNPPTSPSVERERLRGNQSSPPTSPCHNHNPIQASEPPCQRHDPIQASKSAGLQATSLHASRPTATSLHASRPTALISVNCPHPEPACHRHYPIHASKPPGLQPTGIYVSWPRVLTSENCPHRSSYLLI